MTLLPTPVPITADKLKGEVCARYAAPEWYTSTEVTLAGRRLDVVAFNLWGARSYRLVGFEVKISYADWRTELANIRKSDEWAAAVDQFIVVAPKGIVPKEEVPRGWGLLEWCKSRLIMRVQPTYAPSATLPREVVARMLTRLRDQLTTIERTVGDERIRVRLEEREKIRTEEVRRVRDTLTDDLRTAAETKERYDALLRELQVAGYYQADQQVKRALRLILQGGQHKALHQAVRELTSHAIETQGLVKELTALLGALGITTTGEVV